MGPGVAMECAETKDGPTIWEDHFYPEIIDRSPVRCCRTGRWGELIFTSLSKEALPMIRIAPRFDASAARTARPMRRIDKITGRSR